MVNKTKTDAPWKTVKRRTSLNKETENIKRKCPSPTPEQMESNKLPTPQQVPKSISTQRHTEDQPTLN
ncbi:hypothetical protein QLX08_005312 [Tetragonisca angustula]|uniref:Uncharacterized protein n=1 Tax=Tetragonisca angustula TaxID=166442 RepID=A0AAW0ZYY5_9HYME